MTIWFKDVGTKEIIEIKEEDAEEFQERYDNPANLIIIDVYYSDGAGFNGKISKIAYGQEGSIKIFEKEKDLTNNEAEYLALIEGMEEAPEDSIFFLDSRLVVYQIDHNWKCNFEHLEALRNIAKEIKGRKNISLRWIPREQNLAGIELDKVKKVRVKDGNKL